MKEIILIPNGVALVDDSDFDNLSKYKWYLSRNGYALMGRNKDGIKSFTKMHRFIMNISDPKIKIDHKDRVKINNQRSNLRVATSRQNIHNSKKRVNTNNNYKGTQFIKKLGLWQSRCRMNGGDFYLGLYKTEISAAYAFNKKAIELSEFSLINHLPHSISYLENKMAIELVTKKSDVQSKYKHIFFKKKEGRMKSGKWFIRFKINSVNYYKGYFFEEKDALNFLKNNYAYILNTAGDKK